MIDTIILDLDGPLLDGINRHYRCYSQILNRHGFIPIARERYWRLKRQRYPQPSIAALSNAHSLTGSFRQEWLELIESQEMLSHDQLQPGVLNVLREWQASGIRLILATMRNHRRNTIHQLEVTGLFNYLDDVCITGAHEFGVKAAAVSRRITANCSAVWVGDTEVDIRAARELGIPSFAVTCGLRDEALLAKEKPDALLSDICEVASRIRRHKAA